MLSIVIHDITNTGKCFSRKLDFKHIKIGDIHRNCIGISLFGYDNKEKHPIYVSKRMLLRKIC